jgi:hypothetical protein
LSAGLPRGNDECSQVITSALKPANGAQGSGCLRQIGAHKRSFSESEN